MPDKNGREPGDPNYDPSTETTSPTMPATPGPNSSAWTPGAPITTDPLTGAPLPPGSTMGPNEGQINFAPGAGPVTNIPPGYQEGTAIPISNLNSGGDLWHQIDAALTAGGWPRQSGDVDFWLGKVNETGGTFSDYWKTRISDGPGKGSNASGSLGSMAGLPTSPSAALAGLPSPAFNPPSFTPPPAFVPTTAADVSNGNPGFDFRVNQGRQTLEASAAARGTLNSGGTLKDILDFGQNAASQEFQNIDTRRRADYGMNYQTQYLDPYQMSYQRAKDLFTLPNDEALKAYQQWPLATATNFASLY